MGTHEKKKGIYSFLRRRERRRRTIWVVTMITVLAIMAGTVVSVSAKEISITDINEFTGTNETTKVYTLMGGRVGEILDKHNLDVGETDKINVPVDTRITTDAEIIIKRGKEITIVADGVETGAVVTTADAHAALIEAGYVPSERDEISVSYGKDLKSADRIELVTISVTEEAYETEIPQETEYRNNSNLLIGDERVIDAGAAGVREMKTVITYRAGKEYRRDTVEGGVKTEPRKRIVEVGTRTPSTVTAVMAAGTVKVTDEAGKIDGRKYSRKISMTATAYSTSPSENGGYSVSAMGNRLGFGIVAVDPRIVPLGSKVYVTSPDGSWTYGVASAEDTGGAIKGNRIDLCYEGSVSEVNMFGRRDCVVYVLE